jgi:hypothetical protein
VPLDNAPPVPVSKPYDKVYAMTKTTSALWGVAVLAMGLWWTGACGGQRGSNVSHPSGPSSASARFEPGPGPTPIDVSFRVGSCTVTVRGSPGSTYRFASAKADAVHEALRDGIRRCLQAEDGGHGTAHLQGRVDANGRLQNVTVSPGGALSTAMTGCLRDSLDGVVLAAPRQPPSDMLVFMVSSCAP